MWHRATGGLSIITSSPGLRVDDQDWTELTFEAFPTSGSDAQTNRVLHAQAFAKARTFISMRTSADSQEVHFDISAAEDGMARAWVVRVHLQPGESATSAMVDGTLADVTMIAPTPAEHAHLYFPFRGKGAAPAPLAGHIAEVHAPVSEHARTIVLDLVRA
jgi:hypothetical protein